MATTYYDTLNPKKNYIIFLKGKIMRLMVPFIVAVLTVLVLRLYLTQNYQLFARPKQSTDPDYIESNFIKYYFMMLPQLAKKLSWLWFLPALFVDSNINYPLLKWSQRRQAKVPIDHTDY